MKLSRFTHWSLLACAGVLLGACHDVDPLGATGANPCANPLLCPNSTMGSASGGSATSGVDPTSGGDPTAGSASGGTGGAPPTCDACGADQVCVQGDCVDVPKSCPCPVETYCDLMSGTCMIGCTKDEECDAGRICDPVKRECFPGCREDVDCAKGQICEGLMCEVGCRKDADCAANEICDGTTCRLGCHADAECPAGQICDDTVCREGCTSDADCKAPGEICDDAGQVCRAGCRDNGDCALEKVCDTTPGVFACVAGCDTIAKCGAGKLCKGGQCTPGCLDHSWCAAGQICKNEVCTAGCLQDSECAAGQICDADVCVAGCWDHSGCAIEEYCFNKQCVPGCGPPGGYYDEGLPERCPVGEACTPYNCDVNKNNCKFQCNNTCNGWECSSSPQETYDCYGISSKYCMLACDNDADCPAGKLCLKHADPPSSSSHLDVGYCRKPCTSNSSCSNMWWTTNTIQQCTCQMQGPQAGKCTYLWNNTNWECSYKTGEAL